MPSLLPPPRADSGRWRLRSSHPDSAEPVAGETARSRWPKWRGGRLPGSRSRAVGGGGHSPEVRSAYTELGGGEAGGGELETLPRWKMLESLKMRASHWPGVRGSRASGRVGQDRAHQRLHGDPSPCRPAPAARPAAPAGFTHPEPRLTEEQLVRGARRWCLPPPS